MKKLVSGLMMAALPLAVSLAWAADAPKDHHGRRRCALSGWRRFQFVEHRGHVSIVRPAAPAMTKVEFDEGRQIYFDRCAGCHGVLRKGATGKALLPGDMQKLGTETLKIFVGFGTPGGMPNFGTSNELTERKST
jgi:nitrite reductase (NO-forming) / hydroxylamine reductase